MKHSHLFILAIACGITGAASAAWNRLPVADDVPVDLASKSITGTQIMSSVGIENTKSLLGSDYSQSSSVSQGKSNFVVQLANQQVINTIYFVNDGLVGTVTCAGSTDNKDWVNFSQAKLSDTNLTGDDRTVTMHFASAQAKYLKISIESTKQGSIRSLSIYGASTSKDFKLESTGEDSSDSGDSVNLNFSAAGGRPVYAFPTPTNLGELNYLQNVFRFSNSNSKFCTIVFDLASVRSVKEFTSSYTKKPIRLEVFVFDKLPEKTDWRGKLTLDPSIFDTIKPLVTGEDALGVGHIKVAPSKTISTQYIALRYEVNYNRNATAAAFTQRMKNVAVMLLGPSGAVLDHFGLLPEVREVAGNDNSMTILPTINSPSNLKQTNNNGNNGQANNKKGNNQQSDHQESNQNGGNGGGFYGGGFYGGGNGGGGGGISAGVSAVVGAGAVVPSQSN